MQAAAALHLPREASEASQDVRWMNVATAWLVVQGLPAGGATALLLHGLLLALPPVAQAPPRARVAAVYGIFAFIIYIIFIFVLPRLNDSLHPGNGGNSGFRGPTGLGFDLESTSPGSAPR